MPLPINCIIGHLENLESFSEENWDQIAIDFFAATDVSKTFQKRLKEYYISCGKDPTCEPKYSIYSIRKRAVNIAVGSFLNMCLEKVKKRGRWFRSLRDSIQELRKERLSFRKYDTEFSPSEDHMVGKLLASRYPDDSLKPYVFEYITNNCTFPAGFLPSFSTRFKKYEQYLQLVLMTCVIQSSETVINHNFILNAIKKNCSQLSSLAQLDLFRTPSKPLRGLTKTQALLQGGDANIWYDVSMKNFKRRQYLPVDDDIQLNLVHMTSSKQDKTDLTSLSSSECLNLANFFTAENLSLENELVFRKKIFTEGVKHVIEPLNSYDLHEVRSY